MPRTFCVVRLIMPLLFTMVCFAADARSETGESLENQDLATTAEVVRLVEQGKNLLMKHSYVDAEHCFLAALLILQDSSFSTGARADCCSYLGVALFCQQRYPEAVHAYRQALSQLAPATSDTALQAGRIKSNLALALSRSGKRQEAEQICLSALASFKQADEEPLGRSVLLGTYAQVLIDSGDGIRAEQILQQALELRASVAGESQSLAPLLRKLMDACQLSGNSTGALRAEVRLKSLSDESVSARASDPSP